MSTSIWDGTKADALVSAVEALAESLPPVVDLVEDVSDLQDKMEKLETIFSDDFSEEAEEVDINATLHRDQYASYEWGVVEALSGCNVAEFNVSNIASFRYLYTLESPDLRGLFFVNSSDTGIDPSYQTLTTEQDITVPEEAVKCYASVGSVADISDVVLREYPQVKSIAERIKDLSDRVDDLEAFISDDVSDSMENLNLNATLLEGKYASYNWGVIADLSGCNVAEFDVSNIVRFRYLYTNDSPDLRGLFFVNEGGTAIDPSYQTLETAQEISVPSGAVTCYASVSSLNDIVVDESSLKSFSERINDLSIRINGMKDMVFGSSTNPLANIRKDAGLLSIFHTVGCIGDSLASGESVYRSNGANGYVDLYEYSWGQCLARMTGNTYYNFSEGGLSTRTWLSAEAGSGFGPSGIHAFDGNHDCTCYFIGLGQNDANNSIPVGTTDDIKSNYAQNADTYCGNLGKIIQRIQEQVPGAPIFVFIDPHTPNNEQAYNAVIPSVVALFNNVWIIDLKTYAGDMFSNSTSIIGSQARVGHYSALGYQQIAYLIATYVDWIISNNPTAFSQVEFIGTEYEY